ncbi:MAG: M28 family peptidase [Gemmatimonadales bacterium]
MPLHYRGRPTVAAITPCDLMTRLYIYADDSMRGREAGTPDAIRATAYIESQVRALGLQPAGDKGSFFMNMPVTEVYVDSASTVTVGGTTYHVYRDFGTGQAVDRQVSGEVVFGGVRGDTVNPLAPDQVQGKIVLLLPAAGGAGGRGGFGGRGGVPNFRAVNPLAGAAAIATISPTIATGRIGYTLDDTIEQEGVAAYRAAHPNQNAGGRGGRGGRGGAGGAGDLNITVTPGLAAAMLGKAPDQAAKGDKGATVAINVRGIEAPAPTRSVVAILPGTDPVLRNQYIVIGGHSDHIGTHGTPVEHDSLKAYNEIAQTEGAERTGRLVPNAEECARINAIKDSLRRIYPARMDSISNGADDDGSGSVSVLEIAEAFAKGHIKPKRSLIFIWQTGEEKGLWGSLYFTNHPTVPRDSIVADLNIDMVGRGEASDVTGRSKAGSELHGNPDYLQLVGSRRLSTELGDIAESVNKTEKVPLEFDYSMDADGHPQRIYCRSDHYEYARYGIPVIFFTTGGHADYHHVTDEPQYIQYRHMARVDQLIFDIAVRVGDLDHRPVVDKAKQDSPFGRCQQ